MSTVRVNALEPATGAHILVRGRLQFTEQQPGLSIGPVNDIGVAGTAGFGVGIAPDYDPALMAPLAGCFEPGHDNYGNYLLTDGSVMVWIPAFFYKIGTGSNGFPVNWIDVKPLHAYATVAAANTAGYALNRAAYNDGKIKAGYWIDKYHCSNNGGVASSMRWKAPLSSAAANQPFAGLSGAPSNNYAGAFAAAKTRGASFFPASIFMFTDLAMLAKAHAQSATGMAWCAWYSASGVSAPRGNNGSLTLTDVNDGTVSFGPTAYDGGSYLIAQTGSASHLAKTTHNGQNSGVADVNGNMWSIAPGLTYGTNGASETGYFVLKTSANIAALGGGTALSTDAWGAAGLDANYDFVGASFGEASASGGSRSLRAGNAGAQVFSQATTGNNWRQTACGIPVSGGASASGTDAFGADQFLDAGPSPASLCPIACGSANNGSNAGVWARNLNSSRSGSNVSVGFRAAFYL